MKTFFSSLTIVAALVLQCALATGLQAQETAVDQGRNKFAQALSLAMADPAVRAFLKTEASRQFDQDYDVLYNTVKNRPVSGGRTFAQILSAYASGGEVVNYNFFATGLCSQDPLLNISFPELESGASADNWNAATTAPVVVVLESGFNGEAATSVKAYDNRGSQIVLSSAIEPTTLTAVVGPSERVIAVNPATMTTSDGVRLTGIPAGYLVLATGDCFDFYVQDRIPIDPPPPGGGGGEGDCQRDMKTTKDELYKVTMRTNADRNWAESWVLGKLELDAHVFFAESGLNSNGLSEIIKSFSLKRTYTNNDWYTTELEIFHWLQANNGDKMQYNWIEVDKNSFEITIPIKFTVKIFGTGVDLGATLKYSEKDENCGSSMVEYCDPAHTPGTEYNTGRVKFKVRHRD